MRATKRTPIYISKKNANMKILGDLDSSYNQKKKALRGQYY